MIIFENLNNYYWISSFLYRDSKYH